jgi:hypothetical protein
MDRTLGSELLSRVSAPVRKMAGPPIAYVSPADASRWGGGDTVALNVNGATIEVVARVHDHVPAGTLLLARDADWPAGAAQGVAARVASLATA